MWISKGYPTVSGPKPIVSAASFKANFQPEIYRTMDQMKENLTSKKEQVLKCMLNQHFHVSKLSHYIEVRE